MEGITEDLRRTARTNMARVGVIEEVAEEVVNHKKSGIVGIYNKYRYDKEKEIALTKWEELLRLRIGFSYKVLYIIVQVLVP